MIPAELERFTREWTIYRAVRPLCPTGYQFLPGEAFARVPAGLIAVRRSDGRTISGETIADLVARAVATPIVLPVAGDEEEDGTTLDHGEAA